MTDDALEWDEDAFDAVLEVRTPDGRSSWGVDAGTAHAIGVLIMHAKDGADDVDDRVGDVVGDMATTLSRVDVS